MVPVPIRNLYATTATIRRVKVMAGGFKLCGTPHGTVCCWHAPRRVRQARVLISPVSAAVEASLGQEISTSINSKWANRRGLIRLQSCDPVLYHPAPISGANGSRTLELDKSIPTSGFSLRGSDNQGRLPSPQTRADQQTNLKCSTVSPSNW